jgi:hypothetical protein
MNGDGAVPARSSETSDVVHLSSEKDRHAENTKIKSGLT